jgi:hypothetical protein
METVPAHARGFVLAICALVVMTGVNFYSHGTLDLHPTFLEIERYLSPQAVSIVVVIYNVGAHLWSLLLGSLSERFRDHVAACPSAMGSLYRGHNDRDRGIFSCSLPCRCMGSSPSISTSSLPTSRAALS